MFKRYKVFSPLQSLELLEKSKETTLSHYGVDNIFKLKEVHDLAYSKEALTKKYNTHKENNTFHTSSIEQDFMTYL